MQASGVRITHRTAAPCSLSSPSPWKTLLGSQGLSVLTVKLGQTDILWWLVFAQVWNGISISPTVSTPNVFLTTSDASGACGCGALTEKDWFQLAWTTQYGQNEHVTFMELVPIVLSVTVWGKWWHGCHLHCNCNNEAVVHLLLSRYSHNANVMHLLRCFFFYEAYLLYNAHFSITHSWSSQHISQSFIT